MTYCVAMNLQDGLLFAADSRTNAGVDHVATFRKLQLFEKPGERLADCRRQRLFPADSPQLGRRLAPGIRDHAGAAVARMKHRLAFGCGHASMEKSLQESQP